MENKYINPDLTTTTSITASRPYHRTTAEAQNQAAHTIQIYNSFAPYLASVSFPPLFYQPLSYTQIPAKPSKWRAHIPTGWHHNNVTTMTTMEKQLEYPTKKFTSCYTPSVRLVPWLHDGLRVGQFPYLRFRMEDHEFAEYISRQGENLTDKNYEFFIDAVEDQAFRVGQSAGIVFQRTPPPAKKARTSRKRKVDEDDRSRQEPAVTKRRAISDQQNSIRSVGRYVATRSPRVRSGFPPRRPMHVASILSTRQSKGVPNPTIFFQIGIEPPIAPPQPRGIPQRQRPTQAVSPQIRSATQTTQAPQDSISPPPPLPVFFPRPSPSFTRAVPEPLPPYAAAVLGPAHPGPLPDGDRYEGWIPKNRDRGPMQYALPPGQVRIEADALTEGVLPTGGFNQYRNPLISRCTPAHVDIRLCGNLLVTVEEILSFFPLHSIWRQVILRLSSSGWSASQIVEYIYSSRQLVDLTCAGRSTVQHQLGEARKWRGDPANLTTVYSMSSISTDRGSHRTVGGQGPPSLIDYYLVDLANGVVDFPSDDGEGALTWAIKHAMENRHIWVKLSQVEQYVRDYGLDQNLPQVDGQADFEALRRCRADNAAYFQCWFENHR